MIILNMMTSPIHEIFIRQWWKINAWYGIVESNYSLFVEKVQYYKKYSARMFDSPLSLMSTRYNELERRQNLVGGPQHQMIVLLISLMVWIAVLPFFYLKTMFSMSCFVQCCIQCQVKSLKVLMQFYCKQCLNWQRQYQENQRRLGGRSETYFEDQLYR